MQMIWNFILFQIPWPVQIGIVAVVAAAILYAIGRVFGWGVARQIAMPVLAVLGAIGLISRARQQGYKARTDEEHGAEEWAENVVVEKRDDLRSLPDDKLAARTDKWTKR